MSKNDTQQYDPIPETAREALRKWDAGESVFTAEMGGLGPGYEQAIHVLAFEIIRGMYAAMIEGDAVDDDAHDEIKQIRDAAVARIDENNSCGGFSGAQVGAATSLACRVMKVGYRKALRELPDDRHIQVSNFWPKAASA